MVLFGKHTKCSLCGRPLDGDGAGVRHFVTLHPEHLESWAERASFENAIAAATQASRWEGEALQHQTGTLLAATGRDR